MRHWTILLLFGIVGLAQPTIVYGPNVIAIEHVSASVVIASDDATSATISYGRNSQAGFEKTNAAMYSSTTTPKLWRFYFDNPAGSSNIWMYPGETYKYQITLTNGGGSVQTSVLTFDTLPNDGVIEEPIAAEDAPAVVRSPSLPPGPYTDYTVATTDCSDLPGIMASLSTYDPAAHGGVYNVRVLIPPEIGGVPVVCGGMGTATGYYNWPARSSHGDNGEEDKGWVIVQSTKAGTDEFAPDGVRAGPKWVGRYAKFQDNMRYGNAISTGANALGTCHAGGDSLADTTYRITGTLGSTAVPMFPYLYCGGPLGGGTTTTAFPDYAGCTAITAMAGASSSIDATVDCTSTTQLPAQLSPGMLVVVPTNNYSNAGSYFVTTITTISPGVQKVRLHIAQRRSDYTAITDPVTFSVSSAWRMPVYKGTTVAEFDTSVKTPQYIVTAGAPIGACPENQFAWDNTNSVAYWCVDPTGVDESSTTGVWRPMYQDNLNDQFFRFAAGAKKYRFVGVEIVLPPVPFPSPSGWSIYVGHQQQGAYRNPFEMTGDRIVFDRMWLHPYNTSGLPSIRQSRLGGIGASNSAILNSDLGPSITWATIEGQVTGAQGLVLESGAHHIHVENTKINAQSINSYNANVNNSPTEQHLTYRRNLFTRPSYLRKGSAEYDALFNGTSLQGMLFSVRNDWELKQGRWMSITGNIFDTRWTGFGSGAVLCLTNYPAPAIESNISSVSDGGGVTISSAVAMLTDEYVMIHGTSGTNSASWNGIHKITQGCNPTYTSCTTVTIEGTTGVPDSTTSATMTQVLTYRGITDIKFQWNWMRRGATHFNWIPLSHNPMANAKSDTLTYPSQRIAINDNLWQGDREAEWNVADTSGMDEQGSLENPVNGKILETYGGPFEFLQLSRNSFVDVFGHTNKYLINQNAPNGTNYGTRMRDNLIQYNSSQTFPGVASFIYPLTNYLGADVQRNVVCCGLSAHAVNDITGTWKFPASISDIGYFKDPVTVLPSDPAPSNWKAMGNFRLTDASKYTSGAAREAGVTGAEPGTEGRGVGVDIDRLMAEVGAVDNARVREIRWTTATVSYFAPDADPCTVEVSTSATWGTGRRYPDGGGDRVRNVSITDLTANTVYRARVLCAVEQPELTFKTRPPE